MCIIGPGTGFGLNWTDFRNPEQILHRTVMNNPYGIPEYMLVDDEKGYWGEYGSSVNEFDKLTIFKKTM
jgi:hypothetical protein